MNNMTQTATVVIYQANKLGLHKFMKHEFNEGVVSIHADGTLAASVHFTAGANPTVEFFDEYGITLSEDEKKIISSIEKI